MRDVEPVAVVNGRHDLLEVAERLGGGEPALVAEVLEELSAFDVFEDEEELFIESCLANLSRFRPRGPPADRNGRLQQH